jgi:hypothetical protein
MDVGGDAETMFPNAKVCPALDAARAASDGAYHKSARYAQVTVPLAKELSRALNRSVEPDSVGSLLDSLMSVQCATVPSTGGDPATAFTADLQRRAIEEEVHRLYFSCNDTDVAKFGAGPLLGEIIVEMEMALASAMSGGAASSPKLMVWSGHDTGPMAPVLGALKIGGAEFPRFNDLLALELYAVDGTGVPVVRLVHNGAVVTGLVPGCPAAAALCPWEAFHKIVTSQVPTPFECGRADVPGWWPTPKRQVARPSGWKI